MSIKQDVLQFVYAWYADDNLNLAGKEPPRSFIGFRPTMGQPTTYEHRPVLHRAWYESSVEQFLSRPANQTLGDLLANADFAILPSQRDAWLAQITLLLQALSGLSGQLLLEFNIPRMGRRIDAVLVAGPVVFVIEFKVGAASFDQSAVEQAWDYALDLKYFHEPSESITVLPIVVATSATDTLPPEFRADGDGVFRPVCIGGHNIRDVIDQTLRRVTGAQIDGVTWGSGAYRPTPTIIEAARSLYAQHSVEAIARFDAGAANLRLTSSRIDEIVDAAVKQREKVICFVTGVPGAGKTLVGLNVATRHRRELEQPTHAVYLSGNAPLIAVLREALTRDEVVRRKARGEKVRKGQVAESVKAFIQNVHHFRDDALASSSAPFEHVVIFDEAQRAWNRHETASFMQRKKKREGFNYSEPEFLISYLDRHQDWAVVVCLIGGGQEINRGEAGIEGWLEAIETRFSHWRVCISSRLTDSEYAAGNALERLRTRPGVVADDTLHLAVSMRSFRAEYVSSFVKALLDCDVAAAQRNLAKVAPRYPIAITRNLDAAKNWVRARARGSERFGLLASSKAQRLKPHAIDIRVDVDPVHWFLNDRGDVRSSYYLEDAATEFQVQGLELDWTCVTWDGDLRHLQTGWSYHDFRGSRWVNVAKSENQNYLRNAYRVLLTRARQGMVIVVPPGDGDDPTRAPEFYDSTFEYLKTIGIPVLS